MSASRGDYVYPAALSPCRVKTTANLASVYMPVFPNSGIGATLTSTSAGALVIDGVTLNFNDSVCVANQTVAAQNGLYEVANAGSSVSTWVLVRRGDFQTGFQLKAGMFTSIGAGAAGAGDFVVLVEPLPFNIGIDPVTFVVG